MKRFVNFLSGFRIAAAFAIIPMIMFGWYWTTFIVYVLAAASDFFDGYLAKKYNATSKLGGVMDHIGDKLQMNRGHGLQNSLFSNSSSLPESIV